MSSLAAAKAETVVEPSIAGQIAAMRAFAAKASAVTVAGRTLDAWQRESREALGLATNRPIIMAGHQAGIWHAGILAKWMLADIIGERAGADAASLLVDQDVNDAGTISYPALVDGTLRSATLPAIPSRREGPTGHQRPVRLGPAEVQPVPDVAEELERIRAAVNLHASAPSLAEQMSLATSTLLDGLLRPMRSVPATRLLSTPLAEALLSLMRSDPDGCVNAYNRALAADPHVARSLAPRQLPLWRLSGTKREPVSVDDSAELGGHLAPRAFLMTAVARLALCDLFIHGTGGRRYERVTEAWMRGWLGVELAPMSVATATLRLPLEAHLGGRNVRTVAELRRVEFDPDAIGRGPSPVKRELLAAIGAAPRNSAERRERYRSLMRHLGERRTARADLLRELREEVRSSQALAASAEIATSRTWPWPLHGNERLRSLRSELGAG